MLLMMKKQATSTPVHDWNAKAVWVAQTNSGYDRQKLYQKGITTIYYSPLDPGAAAHIAAVRNEGRMPGLYTDPHWYGLAPDGNTVKYRQQIDADVARLLHAGEPLMIDLEFVSMSYTTKLFLGSPSGRGLCSSIPYTPNPTPTQPNRPISYTNMPFQNGTVVPIPDLIKAGVHWYPQLYYGSMAPADAAAVCLELPRWNFPAVKTHPFYDGALIASDQRDGAYFTAERLPGMFGLSAFAKGVRKWTKDDLRDHWTSVASSATLA
jgi:hypothetical protein